MSEVPVETAAGDVTPAPRRTGVRHFDAIVSIAAIFISPVSLYTAIQNGRTERQLVAADVWPFPRAILANGWDSKGSIAIGVANAGVGPAKIRSFEMFYRDQPVSSGLDLLRKCCGLAADRKEAKAELPNGTYNSVIDESVLRAAEDDLVLRVTPSASAPAVTDRLKTYPVLTQITFRVCYCSVLDQCWVTNMRSTHTQAVSECTPPEHPVRSERAVVSKFTSQESG
jgi:hypothetical protein